MCSIFPILLLLTISPLGNPDDATGLPCGRSYQWSMTRPYRRNITAYRHRNISQNVNNVPKLHKSEME